jgi:hypothetical protein
MHYCCYCRFTAKLQEMATISKVHVVKSKYPSDTTGGWGDNPAAVGVRGGYRWNVRFLRVFGDSSGQTFPAGSGNVDALSLTYASLTGSVPKAVTTTLTDGSTPLGGSFALVLNNETTAQLPYTADAVEVAAALDDLSGVGDVSVDYSDYAAERIAGVTAHINRDSGLAAITVSTPGLDLRSYLSSGSVLRIGGADIPAGTASAAGTNGETYLTTAAVSPGHPVAATASDLAKTGPQQVVAGQQVRAGGHLYTVRRSGAEVQVYTLAADASVSGSYYDLTATHNGASAYTGCLTFDATGGQVTTALNLLPPILGGVVVTRSGDGIHGSPYVYSVYFEGSNVAGDVAQLVLTVGAHFCVPASGAVTPVNPHVTAVRTVVQGGAVAHQQLTLATDSGAVTSNYYTLAGAGTATSCLAWDATAADVEAALRLLPDFAPVLIAGLTLDTTVLLPGGAVPLTGSSLLNGRLLIGDEIAINGCTGSSVVKSIAVTGASITLVSTPVCPTPAANAPVSRVLADAVQVVRSGTGDSVVELQRVVVTASAPVVPAATAQEFFALSWLHDGKTAVTGCLAFGATAADVQAALDAAVVAASMDLNLNAAATGDSGHLQVTRQGDGSAAWGYGYEYTVAFRGAAGISTVLGNVEQLAVTSFGAANGCADVGTDTAALAPTVDAVQKSNLLTASSSVTSLLAPGDRIRIGAANRIFTVARVSGTAVELTELYRSASATGQLLTLVNDGVPAMRVETLTDGAAAYTHDLYFSHPTLATVAPLTVVQACTTPVVQVGGMRRNVKLRTIAAGGSGQVNTITLTHDPDYGALVAGNVFQLFIKLAGVWQFTSTVVWDAPASTVETALDALLPAPGDVVVTQTGSGTAASQYTTVYNIALSITEGSVPMLPLYASSAATSSYNVVFEGVGLKNVVTWTVGAANAGVGTAANDGFTTAVITLTYTTGTSYILSVQTDANPAVVSAPATFTIVAPPALPTPITVTDVHINTANLPITFAFNTAAGLLVAGDSWTLLLSHAGVSAAPANVLHGTAAATATVAGSAPVKQLTLSPPYTGSGDSAVFAPVNLYAVPQLFTVRDPAVEVQTITVSTAAAGGVWTPGAQYELLWGSNFVCVNYDAQDYEIEAALLTLAAGDVTDLTVTRRTLPTANGYLYSFYFPSGSVGGVGGTDAVDPSVAVGLGTSACTTNTFSAAETAVVAGLHQGSLYGSSFTDTSLPLGSASSSAAVGRFLGGDGTTALPVYRVSGHLYTVTYNTNLGDVTPLTAVTDSLKGYSKAVTVFDALVPGVLPSAYTAVQLWTGVPYNVRVAVSNGLGYSDYSSTPAQAKPATVPAAPGNVAADVALHVNEVQTVTLAATHREEVQVITTAAPFIVEVQLLTTSQPTPSAGAVSGAFDLFFPEVQRLTLTATEPLLAGSGFRLQYTEFTAAAGLSAPVYTSAATCLSWSATAAEVKAALELLAEIDEVQVVRSCDASNACAYGYTWDVSFTGALVRGNVQQLQFAACSTPLLTASGTGTLTTSTVNEGEALGTSTPLYTVTLNSTISSKPFSPGSGQIQLVVTAPALNPHSVCVPWDATAAQVKAAIETLPNVDSVKVLRSNSSAAGGEFGYQWTVFFDGNAMHRTLVPPTLTVVTSGSTCVQPLTQTVNEVLTSMTYTTDYTLAATFASGQYSPLPSAATALAIKSRLELLPQVVPAMLASASQPDQYGGITWTLR